MKTKKILSAALAILTVMATLIIPTAASAVQSYHIDATKTGSLYVYKYEMNDVSTATSKGTGETADAANIPVDAIPFEGVTFKATRVADLVNSSGSLNTTYYTPTGVSLPTAAEAKAMTAIASYTKKTNSSGLAQFTNLPLGIYLIQETAAPAHTTAKVDDFVISVPMTNSAGNGWNYNVNVYPKNETRYTDITIKKTDYLTGETLAGAVFTLEKSEDRTTWEQVETGLTTDVDGVVMPTNSIPINNYYRLTETTAPTGYILDNANRVTYFYINADGKVCNPDSKAIIDSASPFMVTVTNTKPTISKRLSDTTNDDWNYNLSDMTYSANYDQVVFRINVKTPNIKDMSTLNTFKIVDKLDSCYKFNKNGLFEYNNASATLSDYCKYTYDSGTNTLTYDFDTSKLAPNTFIKLNVIVLFNSNIKDHMGEAINNTSQIIYSTKTDTTDSDDVTNTIDSNTVEVHTSGFQFKKTAEDKTTGLKGATFKIYKTLDDAKNNKNNMYVYTPTGSSISMNNILTSDENGLVSIYGLAYGSGGETADTESTTTYYLVETSAPSGYSLLSEPIAIEVGKDSSSFDNTQFKVVNSKKTVLPLTGGHGSMIFIIAGAVVAVSGFTFLFVVLKKKRKKNAE